MEEIRAKLEKLKEKRKLASHTNFREVLEENQLAKRPPNWEKRLENNQKRIEEEEAKQKAEETGQDYELKKSLNYQANEVERWDKIRASKKRQDPESVDYEEATKRQYGRLTKQLKPDLDKYHTLKEKVGDEKFYLKTEDAGTSSKASLVQDSEDGIERMVEDVQKQIEVRGKRSRRRKFNDEADVDYINERNSKFNKKLDRFYGEYTDEIKQNFERGTAM